MSSKHWRTFWRVERGFRAPFQRCGHRHTSYLAARRCASGHAPYEAVRLMAVDFASSVVVHVELRDGSRLAGEPWQPEVRS